MDTNKMREQFEAWISSYIGSTWLKRNEHQMDEYLDENAQFMWEAWQASREAVVMELPSLQCLRVNEYDYQEAREQCRRAIEAQGLRVKP